MLTGIGHETGTNRELSSGDKPIDLHCLVRVFPIYRWDSTYNTNCSSVMTVHDHCNALAVLVFCAFLDSCIQVIVTHLTVEMPCVCEYLRP